MAGCSTPDSAMDQWMATDFTRERILNADVTTMSVGYYYSSTSTWGHQWIQLFTKQSTAFFL